MGAVPLVQTTDRTINQLQQGISQALGPLLNNPLIGSGGNIVQVSLAAGSNAINHGLGRLQQGWVVVDQDASANFYRSAPFSATTLTLVASAAANARIYCF